LPSPEQVEESTGLERSDTAPGIEHQEIAVAGHDCGRTRRARKLQVLIVLRVPAVLDLLGGREPECCGGKQLENLAAAILGQDGRKLRPCERRGQSTAGCPVRAQRLDLGPLGRALLSTKPAGRVYARDGYSSASDTSGSLTVTASPSRTARKKQVRRPVWQATPC
jgi:hypothetical protein